MMTTTDRLANLRRAYATASELVKLLDILKHDSISCSANALAAALLCQAISDQLNYVELIISHQTQTQYPHSHE